MDADLLLGKVGQVRIKAHVGVILLIIATGAIWGLSSNESNNLNWRLNFGVLLALLALLCGFVHELAHVFYAQRLGIKIKEIKLANPQETYRTSNKSLSPLQIIALSGVAPTANLILAAILALILREIYHIEMHIHIDSATKGDWGILREASEQSLLMWLFWVNLGLGMVNLLPVPASDMEWAIHTLSKGLKKDKRMLQVTHGALLVLFLGVGTAGIWSDNLLLLLASVLLLMNLRMHFQQQADDKIPDWVTVKDICEPHIKPLHPSDDISRVAERMLKTKHIYLPVMSDQDKQLLGVITLERVLVALYNQKTDCVASQIMLNNVMRLPSHTAAHEAQTQMQLQKSEVAAVFDGEEYIGLITQTDFHLYRSLLKGFTKHAWLEQRLAQNARAQNAHGRGAKN